MRKDEIKESAKPKWILAPHLLNYIITVIKQERRKKNMTKTKVKRKRGE